MSYPDKMPASNKCLGHLIAKIWYVPNIFNYMWQLMQRLIVNVYGFIHQILPVSKSSQMITFYFENGCVATLRTSGTEPKIKYYTELACKPGDK